MNLIPEKRMDKNGRLVTRHVRSAAENASGAIFPAPRLNEVDAKHHPITTKAQLELFELLKGTIDWVPTSDRYAMDEDRWKHTVPTMPQKVRTTAHEILSKNFEYRSVRRVVSNLLSNFSFYDDMDELCMHLRFAAVEKHYDESNHIFKHTQIRSVCLGHVLSLTNQDIYDDKPDESQVQKAVAVAHVIVAAAIKDSGTEVQYADFNAEITDYPELVQLAVSNPERGEDIAEFIVERGSDAGLVKDFLGNKTALNHGIL